MALPSSGQITFDNVRVEVSQSAMPNYEFGQWTFGAQQGKSSDDHLHAPINVLSSGSRFSPTSMLRAVGNSLSMSAWYGYDHNLYIGTEVTGTLYTHANPLDLKNNYSGVIAWVSSMVPVELGTANATYNINVSGSYTSSSLIEVENIYIYYGKPWANNGSNNFVNSFITSSTNLNGSFSYTYNYTYNAASGSKIYVVLVSIAPY